MAEPGEHYREVEMTTEEIQSSFRTERYAALNKCRWEHFLSMGIPLADQIIFEPGAGIGDQTEWLLKQGVRHIFVNEGRRANLEIIKNRFDDPRIGFFEGDLETCLTDKLFGFKVDFVFCYGVYYHLNESYPEFHIMRGLSDIGEAIALDYLVGENGHVEYSDHDNSTSLSQKAFRPRTETLLDALKDIWGYAYQPVNQLNWIDPVITTENRQVVVASHAPMENPQLKLWEP